MRWSRSEAVRRLLARYPELAAALAAAAIGLSVRGPLAWLAAHQGINVALVVLVAATAVGIDPAALRRLARAWPRVLLAVAAGVTVLPALSWAVAQLVPPGALRDGVLVAGLAPCEIASVATTGLAGGEAAVAAGVLIGSTLATVRAGGAAADAGGRPAGLLARRPHRQPGPGGGAAAGGRAGRPLPAASHPAGAGGQPGGDGGVPASPSPPSPCSWRWSQPRSGCRPATGP